MTTPFRSSREGLLYLLALLLQAGCSEEELPPYPIQHTDAGDRDNDSGTAGTGGKVDQGMIDRLREWGADVGDPDKVCASIGFSCGVGQQGLVKCWGQDVVATPPSDLPPVVQLACGYEHVCALGEDQTIACWGRGTDEALIGSTIVEQGQAIVPEGKYKEVTARSLHTCAIKTDDTVACWGAGVPDREYRKPDYGQASPPPGNFRGITAGEAHTCAIDLVTNEAVCWGAQGEGCLPPEDYGCGQLSRKLAGRFIQLASGEQHVCGLREDGRVECWGSGEVEGTCQPLGAIEELGWDCGQALPPEDIEPLVRIRAGWLYTCGITAEYDLRCWGWNANGMSRTPPRRFSQVSAGGNTHTCGIQTDGYFNCWGQTMGSIPAELDPE